MRMYPVHNQAVIRSLEARHRCRTGLRSRGAYYRRCSEGRSGRSKHLAEGFRRDRFGGELLGRQLTRLGMRSTVEPGIRRPHPQQTDDGRITVVELRHGIEEMGDELRTVSDGTNGDVGIGEGMAHGKSDSASPYQRRDALGYSFQLWSGGDNPDEWDWEVSWQLVQRCQVVSPVNLVEGVDTVLG